MIKMVKIFMYKVHPSPKHLKRVWGNFYYSKAAEIGGNSILQFGLEAGIINHMWELRNAAHRGSDARSTLPFSSLPF